MKNLQRTFVIGLCVFLFMLPVFTASASLVPQPLYADSYYDSFQPDREDRRHYGDLEDYDIDELEDEIEHRQSQKSKKEEDSVFVKILKFIGLIALILVLITLAGITS